MKGKILFIDYLSPDGHIHSTRGQINALLDLGYEIDCVFKEGYIAKHRIEGVNNLLEIPISIYPKRPSHIKARIAETKVLQYAKKRVSNKGYNYTIIQTYEPFSLAAARAYKGAYIVDQNTVSFVDNPIKKLMLLALGNRYHHIVFNEDQKSGLINAGISDVEVVPIPAHYIPENVNSIILEKNNLQPGRYIISPSASSVDHQFMQSLCNSAYFFDFLKGNDLKLIVKKNYSIPDGLCDRIIPLTDYLSEDDYNSLLRHSAFVLLTYPQSFTYRVSGVLLECIKSNIKCLINDLPSFRAYEEYLNGHDIFYTSIEEVVGKGKKLLEFNTINLYKEYNSDEAIKDSWTRIFGQAK